MNVGRAQRIVPRRTRRLVEDRDRGCAFPGCLALHHLECHHVVHWANGGRTDMDGLISLCPHHHDRHHTGDFAITATPDQPGKFTFETRGGHPIGPIPPIAPEPPQTTPSPDPPPPPRYAGPTNEVLHMDWVRFYRQQIPPVGESSDADPPD